ncbi:hypothetical protein X961_4107 [Burkholderia pseudomallei MSHR5613]|nr:hypothetical protein X961_4107 [Burkholderia pseudomallei MSHR5613]CAJ5632439.1 Uncharacterised protein [Burkholderia pseudomallei]
MWTTQRVSFGGTSKHGACSSRAAPLNQSSLLDLMMATNKGTTKPTSVPGIAQDGFQPLQKGYQPTTKSGPGAGYQPPKGNLPPPPPPQNKK